MVLGVSFDGSSYTSVPLLPGESQAVVSLSVQTMKGWSHDLPTSPSSGGGGSSGDTSSGDTGGHTLIFGVLSSVQRHDRWGACSGSVDTATLRTTALPECSLRLRYIDLPVGAIALPPTLRPRRLLAFGDSIVEGVGAEYVAGRGGDLQANRGMSTWVAAAAERLDAEFSSVGYGKLAWTFGGNGNVPRFADSWDQLWAGRQRRFRSVSGEAAVPDAVLVSIGTNDGLVRGEDASEEVCYLVTAWLAAARAAMGRSTPIFLCIPFGGFGGTAMAPRDALPRAFEQYQAACGGDGAMHLIDLGRDASTHLTGFQFDGSGRFLSTPESADGIHPTRQRHAELGALIAEAVKPLLEPLREPLAQAGPPSSSKPLEDDVDVAKLRAGSAACAGSAGSEGDGSEGRTMDFEREGKPDSTSLSTHLSSASSLHTSGRSSPEPTELLPDAVSAPGLPPAPAPTVSPTERHAERHQQRGLSALLARQPDLPHQLANLHPDELRDLLALAERARTMSMSPLTIHPTPPASSGAAPRPGPEPPTGALSLPGEPSAAPGAAPGAQLGAPN